MSAVFTDTGRALGYTNTAPAGGASIDPIAQHFMRLMMDAIRDGRDINLPHPLNTRGSYPVREYLAESIGDQRVLLFEACHLTASGQYEKGAAKLLKFVQSVCDQYGDDKALQLVGDEVVETLEQAL